MKIARYPRQDRDHKGDERRYPAHIVHGSEWVPTFATATGEIYFATGNASTTRTEPLSTAIVQASSDLALLASWRAVYLGNQDGKLVALSD